MRSVDKLREAYGIMTRGGYTVAPDDIANEIEKELAERYVELPVDANGAPIRLGDLLVGRGNRGGEKFVVGAIELTEYGWEVADIETCDGIDPQFTAHAGAPTLEEVMRDLDNAIAEIRRCLAAMDGGDGK